MSGAGGNRRGRGRPPGGGKRGPQGDSSGSGGQRHQHLEKMEDQELLILKGKYPLSRIRT